MYIRYQLLEEGEYTGDGIFQGMNLFMYSDMKNTVMSYFAKLPVPLINFSKYLFTESYFTEKGQEEFDEYILVIEDILNQINSPYTIQKVIKESLLKDKILYEDEFQVVINLQEQEIDDEY